MKVKRLLAIGLILCQFVTGSVFATSTDSVIPNDSKNAQDVISTYIDAVDIKNWDIMTASWVSASQYDLREFLYDEEYAKEYAGIHTVKTASLSYITELDISELGKFTNTDCYNQYNDLKVYLVGLDLTVHEESKYFYNGRNYFLVTMAKEDDTWRIALFANAPASMIENTVKERSSDTARAIEIVKARLSGIILNGNGEVIDTNIASVEQLAREKGVTVEEYMTGQLAPALADDLIIDYNSTTSKCPSKIRVQRNNVSGNPVVEVDFGEYCENVLPNEWFGTDHAEALKVGAMCVKFVGWFRVYVPAGPTWGYDVTAVQGDQTYYPNSAYPTCTAALQTMAGIGILNSDGDLFYPRYDGGTPGKPGLQSSGKVQQYGTQYLATTLGYAFSRIINYYYSGSDLSTGDLHTFNYGPYVYP